MDGMGWDGLIEEDDRLTWMERHTRARTRPFPLALFLPVLWSF
jgi:hypothetical protein